MKNEVKELIGNNRTDINQVSTIVIATVKAKALYQKGGWGEVSGVLQDKEFINPNFPMFEGTLLNKLRDNNIKFTFQIRENMQKIVDVVNEHYSHNVVEYRIDRKAHSIKIVI